MSIWKCTNCATIAEGRCRPKVCANCGADKEQLVKVEDKKGE